MATIRPNDNAPDEEVKYILPTATFDLAAGGSYDTDDRRVLSDAEAHPWLTVEYPEVPELGLERVVKSVPYEDDYLSAPNSKAFDLDAIRAEQEAADENVIAPVAVDAGLDQGKSVEVGEVAVTIEAADTNEPVSDEKPRTKRASTKED